MSTVLNTFEYDLEVAVIQVLQAYCAANLDWVAGLNICQGQNAQKVQLPQVAVYADTIGEEVFQTGIWRANVEFCCRIDLDIQPLEKLKELAAACIDTIELSDCMQEITATGLVQCLLVVPGTQHSMELGDRYAEKTISCEICGYSGSGMAPQVPTVTLTASGFTGGFSNINGTFISAGTFNVWPYFTGPNNWILYYNSTALAWDLSFSLPPEQPILTTASNSIFDTWIQITNNQSISGQFS